MEEYKFDLDKCNDIEVPKEIHDLLISSVTKADKKINKKKTIIKYLSSIAASLVIFIFSINMSPALASSISKIPGLEYLVELFRFDKGLTKAIENNFVQHIDKSAESMNIKLTIKDVIIDKRNMIIAYEVSTRDKKYSDLNISGLSSIEIIDDKNNNMVGSIQTSDYPYEEFKITGKKEGIIKVYFNEDILKIPEVLTVKVKEMQDGYYEGNSHEGKYYKYDRIYGEWKVRFNIDTKLANVNPYLYSVNKSINIGEVNAVIEDINIYPTSGEINFKIKNNEDYKFIDFLNARLVDDKGVEYKMRGGFGSVDNLSGTLFSESTYFTEAKELYFKADGALFIPKKDMYIVVDIKNKKILENSGFHIEFEDATFENIGDKKSYNVTFKIKDKEIIKISSIEGASFGGITYDEVKDEKNNKYNNIGFVSSNIMEDSVKNEKYIISGISISDITEEPNILKLKIERAAKGLLKAINIKVK